MSATTAANQALVPVAAAAPPAPVVADSYQALTLGSKTFRFASHFLPKRCRDDAAVVYAFCRIVDDLADDAPSPEVATAALAAVRAELAGEASARPLIRVFREVSARCGIDVAIPNALIDGVLSDQHPVRVANDAELLQYAYRVASTVGLMMCGVLGVRDARALPHAVDLGLAMQLTNICRDVAEDARMGRVYLPADRLSAAGTSTEALLAGTASADAVSRVVREVLAMAESLYRSADEGLRWIPWRARFAILVAARTYRAIGLRLLARGANPLPGRTVVPTPAKVGWLLLASAQFCTPTLQGWKAFPRHQAALHTGLPPWTGVNPAARALPAGDAPSA